MCKLQSVFSPPQSSGTLLILCVQTQNYHTQKEKYLRRLRMRLVQFLFWQGFLFFLFFTRKEAEQNAGKEKDSSHTTKGPHRTKTKITKKTVRGRSKKKGDRISRPHFLLDIIRTLKKSTTSDLTLSSHAKNGRVRRMFPAPRSIPH